MRLAELLSDQLWFDTTRHGTDGALWEHENTPEQQAERIQLEIVEYLQEQDPRKRMVEAIDILIFATKMIMQDAVREGIPFETVESIVEAKMARNLQKYHEDNFIGRTVVEGLQHSRDIWDEIAYQAQIAPLTEQPK